MEALRQSSVKTWLQCRALFYGRYILGLDLDSTDPNLEYGTLFHQNVERYHLGGPYDAELIAAYTEQVPVNGHAHRQWLELPFNFCPRHPVTGQELDIPFTGTIDRVVEHISLYDLKTSRTSWSQKRADEDIQATAYAYYWWQEKGELLPFTFVIVRKDWKPTSRFAPLQMVTTTRTEADFAQFFNLLCTIGREIKSESRYPCSCRDGQHKWLEFKEVI